MNSRYDRTCAKELKDEKSIHLPDHGCPAALGLSLYYSFRLFSYALDKGLFSKAYFVVPPVNAAALDDDSKAAFAEKRELFYDALQTCGIEKETAVFDYAELFKERPDFFYDLHHTNYDGSVEFTRQVNQDVFRKSAERNTTL